MMDNEESNIIVEAIADEFEKYPFDVYTGVVVAKIIREKFIVKG